MRQLKTSSHHTLRARSKTFTAWSLATMMAISALLVAGTMTVLPRTAVAMESAGGTFDAGPRKKSSKTSSSSRRKTEEARKKREAKKKKRFSLFSQSGKTSASSKEKSDAAATRRNYRKYASAQKSLDRQEKRHAKNLQKLKDARSAQRTATNNRAKARANSDVKKYTGRAAGTEKDVKKAKAKVAEIRKTLPRGVVIVSD